jgi:hypothetical protein
VSISVFDFGEAFSRKRFALRSERLAIESVSRAMSALPASPQYQKRSRFHVCIGEMENAHGGVSPSG